MANTEKIQSATGIMEGVFKGVHDNAALLNQTSTHLSEFSGAMALNAEKMAAKLSSVAGIAEKVNANSSSMVSFMAKATNNFSNIAAATEEMTATITDIAQSTEKTSEITTRVDQNAGTLLTLAREMTKIVDSQA